MEPDGRCAYYPMDPFQCKAQTFCPAREQNEHFLEAFAVGADAALAASVFHFGDIAISELKQYLRDHGVTIRT